MQNTIISLCLLIILVGSTIAGTLFINANISNDGLALVSIFAWVFFISPYLNIKLMDAVA